MQRIESFRVRPFDVPLLEPFGIATGAQEVARNVFVELTLGDGTRGLGEAAPFPAVNGETQEDVLAALLDLESLLLGQDVRRFRAIARDLREALDRTPAALVAIETALLDALCRSVGLPLWSLFGGFEQRLSTDITIPTGDAAHAARSAEKAMTAGFRRIKVKVGGGDLDADVQRVRAIFAAAPSCELLLDANASLTAREALRLLDELGRAREAVVLFEQPTAALDWDGLSEVEREGRVRVAADESARSPSDVTRIIQTRACSVVNIKTAKLGLVGAWDVLATLRSAGFGVMIGGMVETELSMSTSACLAAGFGGVEFVDLDTPLFMGDRPLTGGFAQRGPELDLTRIEVGHGVSWLGPF